MFIGLTGTPGTGKTTVSNLLEQQKMTILSINKLAQASASITGTDTQRGTPLVDVTKVNNYINKTYLGQDTLIIEGHYAHLLRCVQKVIILRCHPSTLKQRLIQKNWPKEKIEENIQAEVLDIILSETTKLFPSTDIFEIDTTRKTPENVCMSIKEIITKGFSVIDTYTLGQIDWLEDYLKKPT